MACIVIGLDGGLTVGGCVAVDFTRMGIAGFEWWVAQGEYDGRVLVSNAAKRLHGSLPDEPNLVVLAAEAVFFRTHMRRCKTLAELEAVLKYKGFVDMSGPSDRTAITVSQSVGIFLAHWPRPYFELVSSDWRKRTGVPVGKGVPYKEWAMRIAQSKIESFGGQKATLGSAIGRGNDHLAEAFLMALAGRQLAKEAGIW